MRMSGTCYVMPLNVSSSCIFQSKISFMIQSVGFRIRGEMSKSLLAFTSVSPKLYDFYQTILCTQAHHMQQFISNNFLMYGTTMSQIGLFLTVKNLIERWEQKQEKMTIMN